jgi:hypothetical protein
MFIAASHAAMIFAFAAAPADYFRYGQPQPDAAFRRDCQRHFFDTPPP